MQNACGSGLIHARTVAVTGGGGGGTEVLLVRATGASRAAGAQRAVALRASIVHWLHQDAVDLLAQLNDVGCGDPALAPLRHCEHILVQRAPGANQMCNEQKGNSCFAELRWYMNQY